MSIAAEEAGELTLAQALEKAGKLNETAEIAAARLERARALYRQSLASLIPAVGLTASMERTSNSYPPFGRAPVGQATDAIGLEVPLFDASNYSGLRAAAKLQSAQEFDSNELERALAYQVTAAFLQTIAAEHQFTAALERRDVAKRVLDETDARVKAGLAAPNDATRSKLEVASAELAQTNAGFSARDARRGLGTLLGEDWLGPLAGPPPADMPGTDVAALFTLADRQRGDLRAQALRARADELLAEQSRAGHLPVLSARGGYSQQEFTDDVYASDGPLWQASLVAEWSLYDGGARAAEARAHEADRRERLARLRSDRRALQRDLASAVDALATSQVALAQAQAQADVARANLTEVQARFAQGLATGLQQADANAALFEAQSAVIARRLAFDQSRFEIRRLVGWWPLTER